MKKNGLCLHDGLRTQRTAGMPNWSWALKENTAFTKKVEETANRKFVEGILAKSFGRALHITVF
jgi:hypothetical protein